jgi:replication-associated recombination protein RarA
MANEISKWRPKSWSDILGAGNRRVVERLQRLAIERRSPPPTLLIGPYGCGKTVLAQHIVAAYACPRPTPTGDPCYGRDCWICNNQGPQYNGDGILGYQHYEVDGNRLENKADVQAILEDVESAGHAAVFLDEIGGLTKRVQRPLLTFLNHFQGVFIGAISDRDFRSAQIPPHCSIDYSLSICSPCARRSSWHS